MLIRTVWIKNMFFGIEYKIVNDFLESKRYLFGVKYKTRKTDIAEIVADAQKNFCIRENILKERIRNGECVKVAFFISRTSMFPAKSLFKEMLKTTLFNPYIFILPDFRFGKKEAEANQKQCEEELSGYKNVFSIKNENDKKIEGFDIAVLPYPYDISYKKYDLYSLVRCGVLPICINYAYYCSAYDRDCLFASKRMGLFWKLFADNALNEAVAKKESVVHGTNVVLSGYCKMDSFKKIKKEPNSRKRIIIAPHHSVDGGYNDFMAMSNFDRYADLFLKLPEMYPQIDFVFRPHPALFLLLKNENFWGEKKVNNYIAAMKSNPNVVYSTEGDYFDEFAKSDGIIQDCGSFLAEYFYTKNPQCYLLKQKDDVEKKFMAFGRECLKNCYIAYNEKEILHFLDDVIVNGNDSMRKQREEFADQVVMLNYPKASAKIIDLLSQELGGGNETVYSRSDGN